MKQLIIRNGELYYSFVPADCGVEIHPGQLEWLKQVFSDFELAQKYLREMYLVQRKGERN